MAETGPSALLQVEHVTVAFGGLVAVDDLSFSVRQGEILALLGPNGAGKTTTFNVVAGRQTPTSGRILFDGRDVTSSRPDERCISGIARTFQITQPFSELTVRENVMVGAMPHKSSIAELHDEAMRFVEMVGLAEKADLPAKGLSTGQRKRLEMARAMATRPKILLLDEVTGGVDQTNIPGIIALVKSLRDQGVTLVMIEHNMRVINELADRALFMNRGTLMAEGTPDEVARRPEVVELYLGAAA